MGTLYECLKEARLEKYYPSFRAQGITKSEALTRLTVHDCPTFGINSAEDKRRLLELISIIKAVHNSERESYQSGGGHKQVQNVKNKAARKRNRSPALTPTQVAGRALSSVGDVRVSNRSRTNASSHQLSAAGAALLDLISDEETSETSSDDSGEHSDYEPAVKHSVTASVSREIPTRVKKTPVEKVKHGAGYNYGVPGGGGGGASAVRPKSRGNTRVNDEKIRVCVRKRPLSKKEIKSGEDDLARAVSTNTLVISEPKQAVDLTAFTLQHEFIFDEVFEESCSNEDVYIRAARPLINCLFDGGSATCFAYGQTGAGKTHTMIGNHDVPGLYLLAAHDIFNLIDSGQYGSGIHVWVSFFEIYCGQLFDLLNKRNRLHAREDGSHRVCIAGLTETEARDVSSLMQVLDYGNSVRSKGVSGVNPDSSRSHAVLQMEVRDQQDKRLGRISFIDLAGSERASDSGEPDRQTRMEGAEINQSLLALKECIRSIDQSSRHKPFRQSKLTHILKDSFMGNSRTCMIANISPGSSSCEHTLNTLRYADRVKELRRNSGSVNKSMNVAMSNILMNIPASAPSLFQPSNILCSSTPMRKQGSRPFTNRDSSSDLQLDPSETPVRGPGVRRKTSSAASRNDLRVSQSSARASSSSNMSGQNVRGSVSSSTSAKSAVVRHVASNVNSGTKQNLSSNSESDQTDTDSNNVTGPQKSTVLSNQLQNIAVKSVNIKTFGSNKSNNNSAVNASVQNIPVVKSTDTENDFPTTDFNNEEEMNDLNRTGNKNPVAASVPVFALAKQSEAQSRIQNGRPERTQLSEVSSVSASVPVLRKKMYTDNQAESDKQDAVSDRAENDFGQQGGSRPQKFAFNPQDAVKVTSESQNGGAGVRHSPVNFKRKDLDKPTPAEATKRSELRLPAVFTESFEDDLLFDPGSMEQRLWTPRTPSESSGTQPRIPQDPSLEPEIPAVLPAKSSDLTTFSQRSPRWHLNKNRNQNNFPGQPPHQAGFRPEPVQNAPNIPAQNKDKMLKLQPSNIITGTSSAIGNATQNQNKHKHVGNETNDIGYRNKFANIIPKQRENNKSPQISLKQEPLTDGFNKISINSKGNTQRKVDYGEKAGSKTEPKEPLSANWFSTPADHDTHITASVNKRRSSSTEQSEKDSLKTKSETKLLQLCEFDQTDLKELEDDYSPLQRDKSRSPTSDSGVVCTGSERTTPNTSKTNELGRKLGENSSKSDYKNSHFSQAGYFSDSVTNPRSGQAIQSGVKHHRVVHSPVNVRQTQNTSPVIKDIPSNTPVNSQFSYSPVSGRAGNSISPPMGKGGNTAVKTEKIQTGAIFSPIHPQPVTGGRLLAKSTAVVSKDILHPTPVSKVSASVDSRLQNVGGDEFVDLKSQLIAAHEDQLASVTSLCKQEMKLLLGAKAGNKSFEEYMKKVGDVLSQKMSTIQILQDQIIAYQLSTQD